MNSPLVTSAVSITKKMHFSINFRLILSVLAVDLLAMTGDSTMTWSSPILVKFYSNDTDENPLGQPITEEEETWIGSLINIGAMIGPFPFSYVAARWGRRMGLLCIAIPHLISFLTFAFAKNIYLFYFGRLFGGLSEGAGYSIMPMYIAEIAEDSNRGMFSAQLNCFWTFGDLIPYLVGPFVSVMWLNLLLAALPAIFFITFFLFAPESPYYLVKEGKPEKAEESLKRLRNDDTDAIKKELSHIQDTINHDSDQGSMIDIFKSRPLLKALMISIALIIFQQLSGLNALLSYCQMIFQSTGSDIPDYISCIIFGSILFISSFIGPFAADRVGRKKLMIISCFGCSLSLVILGVYFYLKDSTDYDTKSIAWLPLTTIVCYIIFMNLALNPIPWTLSSELFPSNVKSAVAPLISSISWLCAFLVTKFFNNMVHAMNHAGSFWFFAGCTFACAIFCIFFVPETKGKSFMEIQKMLAA